METHALMQQGCLELEVGALREAESLFAAAMERTAASGDRPLSEIMPFMVRLYRQSGRLEAARDLLYTHLEAISTRGLKPFQAMTHELLTDVLEELGDVTGALRHSREHLRLFRQIHMETHDDKVRALEVLQRTQFAQRRAELERQKNAELAAALGQLEVLNRTVLEVSLTDELTGLRNRRYLMNLDLHAWARQVFVVAMLDLDHFKGVNDAHGHDAGDRVLRELASRMKECIRDLDLPCRTGGEEFVVVVPNADAEEATAIAERLRKRVGELPFDTGATGAPLGITVSVGVAALNGLEDNLETCSSAPMRRSTAPRAMAGMSSKSRSP
ncbi:MAG: diguanylate cyclase [Pleurocapsa sp. SU_196_0]|nr:diguanylate cyclase [Pleurocapsa sp. SU_196_0]